MRIDQNMEALKSRLLSAAEEKGMSLNQLAKETGLGVSTISRIASYAHYGDVRLSTLFRLSKALGKSVTWLIGEE